MSPARPQDLTRKELLKAEHGTLIKNFHGQPSIVLIYPNSYHIGMSNLGFQKMYCLFNEDPECVCERAFSHGYKTEKEMRSFENNRPLSDFDCVAFSISFENDYINILPALAAANIPLTITERSDTDPIIMAGGTAISINPEPVRTFFDVLFVGEADQSTPEILEALNKETRSEKLNALSQIDGCYLSSAISDCDSKEKQAPITADATIPDFLNTRISPQQLRKYKRKITKDLDQHPAQTLIHTRHTEFGDLSLIELQRGCEHGCKFCAECFVASPFRERSYTVIEKQISEGLKQRNTLGLVGTNLLRYPDFLKLIKHIHAQGGRFSPSSLRTDDLTKEFVIELKKSGHKTIAIAPEVGSDTLRQTLNKKITNDKILKTVHMLCEQELSKIKFYFMIGFPMETDADIKAISNLMLQAREITQQYAKDKKKITQLILTISPFIPKPRTPFANHTFSTLKILKHKINQIKKDLLPRGGIQINHDSPWQSLLQALLSNGTQETSRLLLQINENKGNFKQSFQILKAQS